jgi:uncharacterized NAD-dependent epimerase/dehydratase family protein
MLSASDRVAILLHGGITSSRGKTGISLLRYSHLPIVAVIDRDAVGQSLKQLTGIDRSVPIVGSVADALAYAPTALSIGIAPSGGALPAEWRGELTEALSAGLSIVNGLHTSMAEDAELQVALQPDRWIWDVRREPEGLTVGSGKARSLPCRRVLTVGTDMGVGKMSTSLELHQAGLKRGVRSRFIATGQTGLMLGEDGIPLDAVRVDYAAGAVEQVVLRHGNDHDILHIEGQGSFVNPASTATLPLMRGSQPTHLVLVHRAGQTHIQSFSDVAIPSLKDVIRLYETVAAASPTFPAAKVAGIALNTFHLPDDAAQTAIAHVQEETGLPCADAIRYGADPILDAILKTPILPTA